MIVDYIQKPAGAVSLPRVSHRQRYQTADFSRKDRTVSFLTWRPEDGCKKVQDCVSSQLNANTIVTIAVIGAALWTECSVYIA
jgi:hypothetical protein